MTRQQISMYEQQNVIEGIKLMMMMCMVHPPVISNRIQTDIHNNLEKNIKSYHKKIIKKQNLTNCLQLICCCRFNLLERTVASLFLFVLQLSGDLNLLFHVILIVCFSFFILLLNTAFSFPPRHSHTSLSLW